LVKLAAKIGETGEQSAVNPVAPPPASAAVISGVPDLVPKLRMTEPLLSGFLTHTHTCSAEVRRGKYFGFT